ncbi:hypothetical protein Sulac_0590 [Sulfobacillus acidophilus DSM 10332]|uniref:Uncharacterized protein n=1 Tax=Sulfobacillus acidophilus (strain ATCC 700253 / DSM 10332 / NAL) TaxID=679936 RepID=G8TZF0_SULAD|nr:hypothetical protein Sulac_0590 [Sulfobacillus acidophilus DSM 10332]
MVDWSFDAVEVQWMTERLTHFGNRRLVSIAPSRFPAYGRLFHPARAEDGRFVRWAVVAAYHGVPMTATTDFTHLALPQRLPAGRTPWIGDPPRCGTLEWAQAERLIHVLRSATIDTVHGPVSFRLDASGHWLESDPGSRTHLFPHNPSTTGIAQ